QDNPAVLRSWRTAGFLVARCARDSKNPPSIGGQGCVTMVCRRADVADGSGREHRVARSSCILNDPGSGDRPTPSRRPDDPGVIYMPHRWSVVLVLSCFASLFFGCYFPVFFQDQQFGFRDAAHYYYPLYQRVQQEWDAGRVPLWEIEENAGMPLLGNPTAAVFYPLKLIYGLFPYAWGARLYIVVHT